MPYGQFYGFPSLDGREFKLAEHTGGAAVPDPSAVDRALHASDIDAPARFLGEVMPGVPATPLRHCICMYTMTPDAHFVVDRHPGFDNVVFGAGFSGHGFKFTSVLGEALADLATERRTPHPIDFLRVRS